MSNKHFTPAQKIAKESTISFAGMGYGQFIRYLFTAILARLVGVQFLGIYSLGNAITNIASVLSRAGTDVGIMRYISMRDTEKDRELIKNDISSTLKIGLVFSIIVMLIQILLSKWLTENVFEGTPLLQVVLMVYAISIPFTSLLAIATYATQGFQLLKYKVFVEYILNPTILIVSMLFLYFTFSSELAIILPTLLTGIIGFIVANYFLKKVTGVNILNIGKFTFNMEILTYSVPIMFTVILGSLLHWMDIMMLGYFTNNETVGLYHPAVRTAGLQQSILIAFAGIFAPMFSKYFAQNDLSGMDNIYKLVTRWILTLVVPILVFIILFSKKVMLLFGTDFIQSANVLIILTIGSSIFALCGLSGRALVVSGHQRVNFYNALVVTSLNIILNIILIPKHGIIGAAIATLTSMVILAIARIIETRIYLKINFFNMKALKPVLAGLCTYGFLYFIKPHLMEFHTILTLVFAILIIFSIYFIILFLFKFDEDDKDFLHSIKFLKNKIIKQTAKK